MLTAGMSGADATWLHMDRPTNLMVVNTMLTFTSRPEYRAVLAAFQERVVARFPRFRQRAMDPAVTLGPARPSWQEASVDLRDLLSTLMACERRPRTRSAGCGVRPPASTRSAT